MIEPIPVDASFWTKVICTLGCGLALGLERQLRGKPSGMRTSTLICMGSMLFILVTQSPAVHEQEVYRVVGLVITGIGFFGGGIIFTNNGLVNGVTSAAVIWVLSGIGIAIGLGHLSLAIAITLISLFILVGVEILENGFRALRRGVHSPGNNTYTAEENEQG